MSPTIEINNVVKNKLDDIKEKSGSESSHKKNSQFYNLEL